jgi:quercetin dioxygenase-like cupin family protein
MTTYQLSQYETVTIIAQTEACLQVRAEYAAGGRPPPMHWHPAQTERFKIVSGTVRVIVDRQVRDVSAGHEIAIAAGSRHRMWNQGGEPAVVEWFTEPAGRTQEWFALVSDLSGQDGRRRDLAGLLAGLSKYGDVFCLSTRPRWLARVAVGLEGPVARRIVARRRDNVWC